MQHGFRHTPLPRPRGSPHTNSPQEGSGAKISILTEQKVAAFLFVAIYDRPVHIAHISLKEEILLIRAAKEYRIKVTCEVCPHHLLLTKHDVPTISHGHPGRGEVRPRLATTKDVEAPAPNFQRRRVQVQEIFYTTLPPAHSRQFTTIHHKMAASTFNHARSD
jgi:hypothetical protein